MNRTLQIDLETIDRLRELSRDGEIEAIARIIELLSTGAKIDLAALVILGTGVAESYTTAYAIAFAARSTGFNHLSSVPFDNVLPKALGRLPVGVFVPGYSF